LLIVSGLVAACLLLSSCATFKQNNVAVRLNGDTLTTDHLSDMARSDLYAKYLQSGIVGGVASGNTTRDVITVWLKLQVLEQSGVFDNVDRGALSATLQQSNTDIWDAAPSEMRDLLVRNAAASQLANNGQLDGPTALAPLATADVFVDARYGRWDPATLSVVPLES